MGDRISELPGDILNHIFSFLHTKDVVKTSILSKKWEYAWKSAACLDFAYLGRSKYGVDHETKLISFKKFVDRVVFHHSSDSSIKKCAFRCVALDNNSFPSLNSWISAVLVCNVQELYVFGCFYSVFKLPPSLYTCRTLVVLKLVGSFTLNLPLHIDFPNLKILFLKRLNYGDDLCMQRLLSCCPALEVLEMIMTASTRRNGIRILSIYVPSLKRLVICFSAVLSTLDYEYKMVTINAPYLESLKLSGNVSEDFSLKFSNRLVRACFEGNCASKAFKLISHVKELSLSNCAMENLNVAFESTLPFFFNLVSLRLEIYDVANQGLISNLLVNSPNLQVVSFSRSLEKQGGYIGPSPWIPPESPPDRFSCNMKRVEFHHFHGTMFEVFLARYMLEHAPVLSKMVIYLHNNIDLKTVTPMQTAARDAILLCKPLSTTCEIEFRDTKVAAQQNYGGELEDPFLL